MFFVCTLDAIFELAPIVTPLHAPWRRLSHGDRRSSAERRRAFPSSPSRRPGTLP
jgi:hypothetical protein